MFQYRRRIGTWYNYINDGEMMVVLFPIPWLGIALVARADSH